MTTVEMRRNVDDHVLVGRVVAGDRRAFEALYGRYGDRIFGYCERILGSPHEAADAAQDTFVKLLQKLPTLDVRHGTVQPYLFAIARNVCFDMMRSGRRHDLCEDVPDDAHARMSGPVAVEDDPERAVLHEASVREIRQAHDRLPDRYREVLALREISGFSYDEIGETMGLNRNAVAQLILRARLRLRDELHGTAAASVCLQSRECRRATEILSRRHDRHVLEKGEREWVAAHLAGCSSCKVAREALAEAGRSYRMLGPAIPLVALSADDAWARSGLQATTGASTAPVATAGVRAAAAAVVLAVATLLLLPGAPAPGVRQAQPLVEAAAPVRHDAAAAPRAVRPYRTPARRSRRRAERQPPASSVPPAPIPAAAPAASEPAASEPAAGPRPARPPQRRRVAEVAETVARLGPAQPAGTVPDAPAPPEGEAPSPAPIPLPPTPAPAPDEPALCADGAPCEDPVRPGGAEGPAILSESGTLGG
jgi:RNA polymerase sigma factor (sigma-70 family)